MKLKIFHKLFYTERERERQREYLNIYTQLFTPLLGGVISTYCEVSKNRSDLLVTLQTFI